MGGLLSRPIPHVPLIPNGGVEKSSFEIAAKLLEIDIMHEWELIATPGQAIEWTYPRLHVPHNAFPNGVRWAKIAPVKFLPIG